jgi:CheY-like chemotaxis protein
MQSISRSPDGDRIRILIVDYHEVSRAACAALLRTEGLEVVDVPPAVGLAGLTRTWVPDVVLIDVNPPAPIRRAMRQLRSVANAPAIVLTSSARPRQLHPSLAEMPFLPKADICAGQFWLPWRSRAMSSRGRQSLSD